MSDEIDTTNVQPIIDARAKAVSCKDYFPSCDFVAADGRLYIEHVQDVHRLRDLHENDQTYLCCPFKPCAVKTIAWSCLRGHMERHLSIHADPTPADGAATAAAKKAAADAPNGRHADADGAGHHLAAMDHTASVVTPIYNQSSNFETDTTHAAYAVSDFGFSATSGFGVADAVSSAAI
ncbi:hypothetical protein PsYK624_164590 [Phanerochaete sordida]|uniref:Uncharacterized protein n=1 Tax=Phanerochaete sordida TaxID=48140 RepID=A0A9P3LN13_9APHY|nr:hypothetical protein PsYK624_164590 [Phanerochaete sordida]